MSNNTIKNKIRKTLNLCEAKLVEINKIKGIKTIENKTIVDTLYVSMGECTGQEFEAIKRMREQVSMEQNIEIINIIIDL